MDPIELDLDLRQFNELGERLNQTITDFSEEEGETLDVTTVMAAIAALSAQVIYQVSNLPTRKLTAEEAREFEELGLRLFTEAVRQHLNDTRARVQPDGPSDEGVGA